MHPALFKLGLLRLKGFARRFMRMLGSKRGALLAAVVLLGFGSIIGSNLSLAYQSERVDPEIVRSLAPLAMLAIVVASLLSTQAAVPFSMPEVEFLFPGPFSRRQLLLYKLSSSVLAASFSAAFLATVFLRYATWWVAGWIGLWLSLIFIQLLSMTVALLVQSIGQRAYSRARRTIIVVIMIAAVVGLWQVFPSGNDWTFFGLATEFRASTVGQVVLAPFEVFGRAITAEALIPEFLLWAAAAVGIDLVLVAVVLLLDANYLEASTVASQKRYEAINRAKGGRTALAGRHTARWRLPELPWLAGAGPLAWRQSIQLVRTAPRALLMLVAVSVFAAPGIVMTRSDTTDLTFPIIGIVAWASFFVGSMIPSGFRGDLDAIDWFKMLPIRPAALVVGELLPPVLFVSALQAVVLAGCAALGIAAQSAVVVAAVCYAVPVNLLFVSTENLLFLRYPSRVAATSPGDFQFMGRQMAMMLARMLLIFAACGIAGLVIGALWFAGIQSRPILAAVGWFVLVAEGVAFVQATVSAFREFDPSSDMPG